MLRKASLIVGIVLVSLSSGMQAASATWSLVAVDEETGEVGVAVASCVGFEVTVVPVLVPGVGAAASQAAISELSGTRLVESIAEGATAVATVETVVGLDDAPESRQFGVVVLGDGGAGWSGSENSDVALDRRNADGTLSVQGNILVADDVVTEAIAAFEAADGQLADRLVAGLIAGADAGGDSRCGVQTATAAALIVARPGDLNYAFTDAVFVGVDPQTEIVPSVFLSVLVEEGGDRAPDRLAVAWAGADRAAESVVVREIDDGADTALRGVTNVVIGLVVVVVAIAVFVGWAIIRSRQGRRRP